LLSAALLAACGGRIDTAPTPDVCSAAEFCAEFGDRARGAYSCDGGMGYACCGYTEGELQRLIDSGDTVAPHCEASR
jgi:hypothetical protein